MSLTYRQKELLFGKPTVNKIDGVATYTVFPNQGKNIDIVSGALGSTEDGSDIFRASNGAQSCIIDGDGRLVKDKGMSFKDGGYSSLPLTHPQESIVYVFVVDFKELSENKTFGYSDSTIKNFFIIGRADKRLQVNLANRQVFTDVNSLQDNAIVAFSIEYTHEYDTNGGRIELYFNETENPTYVQNSVNPDGSIIEFGLGSVFYSNGSHHANDIDHYLMEVREPFESVKERSDYFNAIGNKYGIN